MPAGSAVTSKRNDHAGRHDQRVVHREQARLVHRIGAILVLEHLGIDRNIAVIRVIIGPVPGRLAGCLDSQGLGGVVVGNRARRVVLGEEKREGGNGDADKG